MNNPSLDTSSEITLRRYWKEHAWRIWSPKLEPLSDKPSLVSKISICTACMGRAHDLKRTLISNILDNEDYPALEFVVLNYNSQDDMHEFMMSAEVRPHFESGRLKYLRTRSPHFFSMSHSRNVTFRASSGHIITNVDADNFTGRGFATYLNRLANVCPRHAIFAKGKRRIHGRLAMYRSEFEEIGGYDEDLEGYGYEDHSLMMRAMSAGHTLMWWAGSEVDFMRRIITPREIVGDNMTNPDWKATERMNKKVTMDKIARGDFVVNKGRKWGYIADLELFG